MKPIFAMKITNNNVQQKKYKILNKACLNACLILKVINKA